MAVAGTKAAIPEMLESTLEHEILHEGEVQCHLPDFVLGNLRFLRTDKRTLLGGVVKALLACLKDYSSLLPISQNKIVQYAWIPSYRRHNRAPAKAVRTLSRHQHRHLDTTLTRDPKRDVDYFSAL